MSAFWTYFFHIANLVVIVGSAILIAKQISKQHEWNRRKEARALADKFTSENMTKLRYSFEKSCGNMYSDDVVQWEILDSESQDKLRTLLNFFEEVGVARTCGAADEDMLCAYFEFVIPRYFTKYHLFIDSVRKKGNQNAFIYMERMAQDWSRRNRPFIEKTKL